MTSRTASSRAGRSRSSGQLEADVRGGQGAFGPNDALGDRRSGHQERPGDLLGAQPADQLEGERRAGIGRQDRVAGHEDQPEQVVGQVAVDDLVEARPPCSAWRRPAGTCCAGCRGDGSGRRPGTARSCSARPPGCRARRPRRHFSMAVDEDVLGEFLGGVEVADQAHRAGRSPAVTRPATASPRCVEGPGVRAAAAGVVVVHGLTGRSTR